jgi:hypothetical protein
MALAVPVFALASAINAAAPALESAPYIGDPPLVRCQYSIDDVVKPQVLPTQTELGPVCRFNLPATITEGFHKIRGRFIFLVDGVEQQSDASAPWYFRKYAGTSGATFYSWDNAVICDPDCVSK